MKIRHRRLIFIVLGLASLGVAVGLALNAFRNNLVFYYTPSQIVAGKAPVARTFRMGGLVEKGSVKRNGLATRFIVTDLNKSFKVRYTGVLPDLFREGQGVVAQGRLGPNGVFIADQVLAKHDEKYMPPEVAQSLKKTAATP